MPLLAVYAAAKEGDPLLPAMPLSLRLGTGKSAAAATLAAHLAQAPRPDVVLAFGLCGSLPVPGKTGLTRLPVGSVCLVEADRLADEGRLDGEGFTDLAALGLGSCGPYAADAVLTRRVKEALDDAVVVQAATVSTCSGTDPLAAEVQARSGASIETMEGAAIMMVCARFMVPVVQLRVVSNWTGDRYRETFALDSSLSTLHQAVRLALTCFQV